MNGRIVRCSYQSAAISGMIESASGHIECAIAPISFHLAALGGADIGVSMSTSCG